MPPFRATASLLLVFAAPSAAAKDFSFKAFLEYKKATLTLTPTKAARADAEERGLETPAAVTYQPNAVPAVGVGASFMGVGASYGQSIPQSRQATADRGESQIKHLEVHVARKWFGFDVYRQQYEGFFRRDVPIDEVDPLGDSLFKTGEEFTKAPALSLVHDGAAGLAVLRPDSFPLDAALSPGKARLKSGWSPLIMIAASRLILENDAPLVPDEQREYFGDDAALTGGTFYNLGILPGLGFALASSGGWFFAPVGFCGVSWQVQEFTGIDRRRTDMRGTACDIRGTIGYSKNDLSAGFIGFKSVTTVTAETVNLSHASSSVQFFLQLQM